MKRMKYITAQHPSVIQPCVDVKGVTKGLFQDRPRFMSVYSKQTEGSNAVICSAAIDYLKPCIFKRKQSIAPKIWTNVMICDAKIASEKNVDRKRTKLKDATIYRTQRPIAVPNVNFDESNIPAEFNKAMNTTLKNTPLMMKKVSHPERYAELLTPIIR